MFVCIYVSPENAEMFGFVRETLAQRHLVSNETKSIQQKHCA